MIQDQLSNLMNRWSLIPAFSSGWSSILEKAKNCYGFNKFRNL